MNFEESIKRVFELFAFSKPIVDNGSVILINDLLNALINKSTVKEDKTHNSLLSFISSDLLDCAVSEINKAQAKFLDGKDPLSKKIGLQFDIILIRDYLSMSDIEAVAVAAYLEYITSEIIDLSKDIAKTYNTSIRSDSVIFAIKTDEELSKTFSFFFV
jgi:hypothetical protein